MGIVLSRSYQFSKLFFHSSAAKPNYDKCSKTERLDLARDLAGDQVRPKFCPKSRKHNLGLLLTLVVVGVVTFWIYIFIFRTCVGLLNQGWRAFFLHTPVWVCKVNANQINVCLKAANFYIRQSRTIPIQFSKHLKWKAGTKTKKTHLTAKHH